MFPPDQPGPEPVIEVRHLRYFIAVAEEMHFGRAAERLHMAQSPLSHQIRQLERRLGVTLLDRDHHVVGLTDAGAALLEEARAVLAALERAVERTRRAGGGEVGRIGVGYVPEMTAELLPRSLRTHRQRFPDVAIDLCQGMTGEILEALSDRRLDVGFVRTPGPLDDLHYEDLVREDLLVARPEGPASAGSASDPAPVDLPHIGGETVIVPAFQTARGLREDIEAAFTRAGQSLRSVREATSPTAMLLLVAAGAGVALVPASVARSFPLPGVEFQSLASRPTTSGGMCWRRGDSSKILANFLDTTRGLVAGYQADPAGPAGPAGAVRPGGPGGG